MVCLCPHAPYAEHRGVNGCAAKIMAVFNPQHVLGPPSDQYCSAAAVRGVVDSVGPLSPSVSGSIPLLRTRTAYFSHPYAFLFIWIFSFSLLIFFCHPHSLRLSLATYTLTGSIGLYLLTLPCHISITRQNGYGLLLGSHLHISLSYIFQKVVRGFSFFRCAAVGTAVSV